MTRRRGAPVPRSAPCDDPWHLSARWRPGSRDHVVRLDEWPTLFWTYPSVKGREPPKDRRVAVLVETGTHPGEVRGVQIEGYQVAPRRNPGGPRRLARVSTREGSAPDRPRRCFTIWAPTSGSRSSVEPVRIASWDHRKLIGEYPPKRASAGRDDSPRFHRGHQPGDDADSVVHPILVRAESAGAVASFIDQLVAPTVSSRPPPVFPTVDIAIASVAPPQAARCQHSW